MVNPFKVKPAPPAFGAGKVVPEVNASFLSKLFFTWLSPFLDVGFSRPLEQDDLWDLPEERRTAHVTELVESHFYARCPPEIRPRFLRNPGDADSVSESDEDSTIDKKKEKDDAKPSGKKEKKPKYDGSLPKALFTSFQNQILWTGFFKLLADTLKTTSPLVTKVFLNWLAASYVYHNFTDEQREAATAQGFKRPQGIGYGIGVAVGLFVMQEAASLSTTYYMITAMTTGIYTRTALIGNIFRKSLRLSGKARLDHSVGQITTLISTDTSRLDRFSTLMHNLWVAPIQIIIGVGLLLGTLGYSALVGLGVLILGFPLQFLAVQVMMAQRRKGVKITDNRMRLTAEVLQGIRLIKFFSWEDFYSHQITLLRSREIRTIQKAAIARGGLFSLITAIPITASTLSFITYALSGHDLNVAIIFTSLQLFNVIRGPLIMLPLVLGGLAESIIAFGRIGTFLKAEEIAEPYLIDKSSDNAIVVDGDFAWEQVEKAAAKFEASKKGKGSKQGSKEELPKTVKDVEKNGSQEDVAEEKPFELKNLKMTIPRGSFVAIVGKVGSGKSSVIQAMIGEMRKTRGDVNFGGTVAYVPQTPWIKNLSLRDNVTFGLPDDDERFQAIVKACSLERDIEMLPQNENTEIGERGINLSGGQKARVSLARAAYSHSDIILMDDSLSAVDAYVGKAILENCILTGPLASRTRVLVTHALHVLDKADYIYVIDNGTVAESGTYTELMSRSTKLSALMEEYGSLEESEEKESKKEVAAVEKEGQTEAKKTNNALMQNEERTTGAVSWSTYGSYLRHAGGIVWAPTILLLLVMSQAASVGSNLLLGFWTGSSTGSGLPGFTEGKYIGVYAALGIAQAIVMFVSTCGFFFMCLQASLSLFRTALARVLDSPISLFDTTPIGRILSRFSRDQDILDEDLAMTGFQFTFTFSMVWGTVFLVFYTFPLLGIIFAPMIILYYGFFLFYRRSSVETKRLDSLLRSKLYASFSESLTGLATIRAYGIQDTSVAAAEDGLDWQNKAYYLTVAIQRWLSVRLDLFANILVLGIALFAAGFRNSVSPSKIGVVLTYSLSVTQLFSDMVAQFAQTEQNMNAAERVLEYTKVPLEGDKTTPNDPPAEWPQKGGIEFTNVELAYRPDLPLVLKDVTFNIKEGEKVGIVGRTGAGKSSLLQALFRMAEVRSGKIMIDGVDIRNIGLSVLRTQLALVPQDSTLFLGTLRENIDPMHLRTDAELISVLQRAWLLPPNGVSDPAAEAKFNLDATVGDEGSNYSAGEKQLLALARALAKNSRIIVLDEATSSVDVETDSKLQRTIQTEFEGSTLLCIAHRLNTIAYYDRVLVMDAGKVAEFDTVLNLFDREDSIFRSLCNEANLSRSDILRIRAQNEAIVSGDHHSDIKEEL